jgi:hypothetical protein
MRRSVVGIVVAFASVAAAPRVARADVNYPAIPSYVNPSTVTWFYGCTDALPGACLTIGIGRTLAPATDRYVGVYGAFFTTPSGVPYSLFDTFTWSLPDGSCFGSGDDIIIVPNNCFVQNIQSGRLTAQVEWSTTNPPFTRASVLLTATPEPASLALFATGLLAVAGVGASRRRRPKTAA